MYLVRPEGHYQKWPGCRDPNHGLWRRPVNDNKSTQKSVDAKRAKQSTLPTDGDTCENDNRFCDGPDGEILPCFDCFTVEWSE